MGNQNYIKFDTGPEYKSVLRCWKRMDILTPQPKPGIIMRILQFVFLWRTWRDV